MESMSPRINSTTELISYKESILWNQRLGSLKVKKNSGSEYSILLFMVVEQTSGVVLHNKGAASLAESSIAQ
jgi:hypothetical protein